MSYGFPRNNFRLSYLHAPTDTTYLSSAVAWNHLYQLNPRDKALYPRKSWQQWTTLVSPVQDWSWKFPPGEICSALPFLACQELLLYLVSYLPFRLQPLFWQQHWFQQLSSTVWMLQGLLGKGVMGRGPNSRLILTFFLQEKFIWVRNLSFTSRKKEKAQEVKNWAKDAND